MHFPLQQIMLPGDTPLCGGLVFLISKINHGTCHIIGSVGLMVCVWDLPLKWYTLFKDNLYDMSFVYSINIRQSEFIADKKWTKWIMVVKWCMEYWQLQTEMNRHKCMYI